MWACLRQAKELLQQNFAPLPFLLLSFASCQKVFLDPIHKINEAPLILSKNDFFSKNK
jgi:hypothetical protein